MPAFIICVVNIRILQIAFIYISSIREVINIPFVIIYFLNIKPGYGGNVCMRYADAGDRTGRPPFCRLSRRASGQIPLRPTANVVEIESWDGGGYALFGYGAVVVARARG